MSDVVKTSGAKLPPQLANFKSGLQRAQAQLSASAGPGKPFLRLIKKGKWVYGQEDTYVEEGSLWAFNPLSIRHGWVCWKKIPEHLRSKEKAEKLGEVMVAITEPQPPRNDLPVHENGKWAEQYGVELACVSGEDEGTEVLYQGTAHGLLQAMHKYVTELWERINAGEDTVVGVTALGVSEYKHPVHGLTFKPEFDFVEWRALDDTSAVAEDGAEEEEDEGAEEEEEAPEPAAAATTRRRRRRA